MKRSFKHQSQRPYSAKRVESSGLSLPFETPIAYVQQLQAAPEQVTPFYSSDKRYQMNAAIAQVVPFASKAQLRSGQKKQRTHYNTSCQNPPDEGQIHYFQQAGLTTSSAFEALKRTRPQSAAISVGSKRPPTRGSDINSQSSLTRPLSVRRNERWIKLAKAYRVRNNVNLVNSLKRPPFFNA